ncbi:MAG: hypothetical protein KKA67_14000 [Spirochaetes bacterium]|nr:hypothetical protein [Spirochaetota bacterium]MBU1080506.1 hypothetical protein [Spirochaetota bacterium]
MERDIEKSDASPGYDATVSAAMDALAVVSVAFVLVGAALSASGASWRIGAYVSIVGLLFDLVLSYEFLARLIRRKRPVSSLAGLSSIAPLLLVSGPFIAGWALSDLGSAAVRGFWLGASPASGLAAVAALRLLRVARPIEAVREDADDRRASRQARASGRKTAAMVGIAVAIAGAFASDALLIPGLSRLGAEGRAAAMSAIAAAGTDAERSSAALAAGAIALRVDGRAIVQAPPFASPADYAMEASGGVEAWFSVSGERRARGAAEALFALASLAASAGYALARTAHGASARTGRESLPSGPVPEGGAAASERRGRPSDRPAGNEELAGILGKRPRW